MVSDPIQSDATCVRGPEGHVCEVEPVVTDEHPPVSIDAMALQSMEGRAMGCTSD